MQGVEPIRHAHLSHENLLPFYGVYYIGQTSRICLVSPWVKNGNLRDYLNNHIQLPRLPFVNSGFSRGHSTAHHYFKVFDIVDGLSYLHRLGIIHGGLKPVGAFINFD